MRVILRWKRHFSISPRVWVMKYMLSDTFRWDRYGKNESVSVNCKSLSNNSSVMTLKSLQSPVELLRWTVQGGNGLLSIGYQVN